MKTFEPSIGSAETPIVAAIDLSRADADPERIQEEFDEFTADPAAYIERRYKDLIEWDFPVYARINIKIQNKNGRLVPLKFKRAQRMLWRWLLEDLRAGKPIRWYILKARQLGISTWILALFYWMTSSRANLNAGSIAQDEGAVTNFNSKVRSIHAGATMLPRSPTMTDRRDVLHFANPTAARQRGEGPGLDSRLLFVSAKHGELGRSFNFHLVHCSEFALWPNLSIDVEKQMGGLNQTISKAPGTVVMIETTAKGKNMATELFEDQKNSYRKIFISWVADEEYRKALKPGETLTLCRTDEANGRATLYGNEVREAQLIENELRVWYPDKIEKGGDAWLKKEVMARLNWRRTYIVDECFSSYQTFRQEYPTCPAHALIGKAKTVFDSESLSELREYVLNEGIEPERFKYNHDPDDLNIQNKFTESPWGDLIVWERKKNRHQYIIAGDPGMGIPNSGDPSALIVLDVTDKDYVEVASFNAIIAPDQFAELCYWLGHIYGGPLIGIENNERGGYAANVWLTTSLKYPRVYRHFETFDKRVQPRPGFVTTAKNKPVLVSGLQQAIRDHEILFRSEEIIDQLEAYIEKEDGTLGGPPGTHDDFVSAAMIALKIASQVHQFAPITLPPPRGSFEWHARKVAKNKNSRFFA